MKNQGLACAFPIKALSIRWNASKKLLVRLLSVETQNLEGPMCSNKKILDILHKSLQHNQLRNFDREHYFNPNKPQRLYI